MSKNQSIPLAIHGWTIFAHPLFLDQLERLAEQVTNLKKKNAADYARKNATKRLAAILQLAFDTIPQDPTRSEFRQGGTLGAKHAHWFRACFFQQYRLFFRYHQSSKVIILGWVNDDHTKRAYESSKDAYRVFQNMLASGHPPTDWDSLLLEAKSGQRRLRDMVALISP